MVYLYSIIIHGIVFLILITLTKSQKIIKEKQEPLLLEYKESIVVEENKGRKRGSDQKLKNSFKTLDPQKKISKNRDKSLPQQKINASESLTYEKLSEISASPYSKLRQYDDYNHGQGDESFADNTESHWGEGGGEFGRLKDFAKMDKMNIRLKNIINYPAAFTQRRIGGIVQVRLVIDEKGECQFKETVITALRSELKFYVLSVLKLLCRGYEWRKIKLRPSSNLDFSFDFSLYSKDPFSIKNLGNVFLVHLPGGQDKGNWKLGPIQGHYLFPGYLLLNPQWIEENWNEIIHDIDPMERFKETEDDKKLGIEYR